MIIGARSLESPRFDLERGVAPWPSSSIHRPIE
jgi:hypothetical protein